MWPSLVIPPTLGDAQLLFAVPRNDAESRTYIRGSVSKMAGVNSLWLGMYGTWFAPLYSGNRNFRVECTLIVIAKAVNSLLSLISTISAAINRTPIHCMYLVRKLFSRQMLGSLVIVLYLDNSQILCCIPISGFFLRQLEHLHIVA